VRWQPGNGAKFWLYGSANMACAAGARTAKIWHFRPPFLWFISFGGAKEMNENFMSKKVILIWQAKNEQRNQDKEPKTALAG
jgi:hypothetical protein